MSSTMADPPKAREIWEHLAACKDKNIGRHIAVLSSPSSEYDEVRAADAALRKTMAQVRVRVRVRDRVGVRVRVRVRANPTPNPNL